MFTTLIYFSTTLFEYYLSPVFYFHNFYRRKPIFYEPKYLKVKTQLNLRNKYLPISINLFYNLNLLIFNAKLPIFNANYYFKTIV